MEPLPQRSRDAEREGLTADPSPRTSDAKPETSDLGPRTSDPAFRSGFIAIIGRPNVGKSTLMNRLVGQKLCIVSPKPQTTWHRILGIRTLPDAQLLFLDTPGIHRSDATFNQVLIRAALTAMADADVVLWLLDATEPRHPDDELILEELRRRPPQAPVLLVLNKIDAMPKDQLLPLIDHWRVAFAFAEIVPVSARRGDNEARLESLIVERLPPGPAFYPPDELSDRPERFFIAEILRERVFHLLRHELPYATAVQVETVRRREGRELTDVEATIFVEKESQKAIVIGSGGQMLKRIGMQARPEIETLLETPVYLKLEVKVLEDWRRDAQVLKRFGYLD